MTTVCRPFPASLLWRVLAGIPVLALSCTGHPASGIDVTLLKPAIRPQDDFYRYANGAWLDSVQIPPAASSAGLWQDVTARIENQLRTIAEEMAATPGLKPGSLEQHVGDLYASFLDQEGVEVLGLDGLAADLQRIDELTGPEDLARAFGHFLRVGVQVPISLTVATDPRHTERQAVFLSQSGLGLSGRDAYLETGPEAIVAAVYPEYIARLFQLAGDPEAEASARAVVDLERQIARIHWAPAEARDRTRTCNPYAVASLATDSSPLAWQAVLDEAGVAGEDSVIVAEPDYFEGLGRLSHNITLPTWQAYLRFHLLDARAPYLPRAFADARFRFREQRLEGRETPAPRWRGALDLLGDAIRDDLGRLWVARYFPPRAKAEFQQYVDEFLGAFRAGIVDLGWMSPDTRERAMEKLDAVTIHVGYPEVWPDLTDLIIYRDDLAGNVQRACEFAYARELAALQQPTSDVSVWVMPVYTVVSYAVYARNGLYFLAGNLQPPYFQPGGDVAANYGALAHLLGHEISHLFDDQGRHYDARGNLSDWWTTADTDQFHARTQLLVEQFNEYEPLPGVHIDGELSLGENIADLSGVAVAWNAYKKHFTKTQAPVIDGLTEDERFFLSMAQVTRSFRREASLRRRLGRNPHAPPEFRVNGTLSNFAPFYSTFDVHEGDGMYRPPGTRVKIW